MPSVFDQLIGQEVIADELRSAVLSPGAMTHAWLFTGPPGSGRSVAALAFAAALQCTTEGVAGCGECHSCSTVMSGTHADVRRIVPEGLTIGVKGMREIVSIAARRPSVGQWQVVVVEDADRLTEQAANALLKYVEEPPERTVILLCAPSDDPEDIAITLRSRCRHVALTMPRVEAIAAMLTERDGVDQEMARWAASVCGGHVGRARRLANNEDARAERRNALGMARAAVRQSTAYPAAVALVAEAEAAAKAMSAARDEAETEELRTALGAGGTGKGAAGALRGSAGVLKDLERHQKSRATRTSRDVLDRALVDLVALFRDALAASYRAPVAASHPDMTEQVAKMAEFASPEGLLRSVEAVLACREALAQNVKPKFAVDAMVAQIGTAMNQH